VGDVAGTSGRGIADSAGERELSCRGTDNARSDAEERGLAGAIAPSQNDTFAGRDFERDAAQGKQAAIALVDVLETQSRWWKGESGHNSSCDARESEMGKAPTEERYLTPQTALGMTCSLLQTWQFQIRAPEEDPHSLKAMPEASALH